jgi:uncharacterized protein
MTDLGILGAASFVAWFTSMLTGGGCPLVLIPIVTVLLGAQSVAPTITTGMLVGNVQRSLLFWQEVDWNITRWYLPGAVLGAALGAYVFTQIQAGWLQLALGVILLLVVANTWIRLPIAPVEIKPWHFLPFGFLNAIGSGIIGSTGPILNPVYLNYGLVKESMIATKAVHQISLHTVKLIAYTALGAYRSEYFVYGLCIGLAGIPANWLGKFVLERMSQNQFRHAVTALLAVSGVVMIWQQRIWLSFS